MRVREDNILKIAGMYEKNLVDDGLYDSFDEAELDYIFKNILSDYKKLISSCKKEGTDIGDTDIEEYTEVLESGSPDDKVDILDTINERILSLMDICENVPKNIEKKYRKDLVTIIEEGF